MGLIKTRLTNLGYFLKILPRNAYSRLVIMVNKMKDNIFSRIWESFEIGSSNVYQINGRIHSKQLIELNINIYLASIWLVIHLDHQKKGRHEK